MPEAFTALRIAVSDFWFPPEAALDQPLFCLLGKRFQLELSERPDVLFYSCFGRRFREFDCMRVFYTGENVRPDYRDCDYAFSFDYPISERNYRLPLYRLYDGYEDLVLSRDAAGLLREKTEFCSFVYSNPAAEERNQLFRMLSDYRPVLSGGRYLNNVGGPVEDKVAFMRSCKFAIAFENSCHPGYTTEKILHAFLAGSVPIYWGNQEVARDFNPAAFINCHEFSDFEAVVEHVRQIDRDEARYRRMLAEPALPNNRIPESLTSTAILDRFEAILAEPRTLRRGEGAIRRKLSKLGARVRGLLAARS